MREQPENEDDKRSTIDDDLPETRDRQRDGWKPCGDGCWQKDIPAAE